MKCNWRIKKLSEIAHINPKESIGKGIMAKKIPMDKLQPFCRDITEFILEEYKGGAKFRNDDTIMARITPCLENGKISKVSILDDDEVGFGSTEYIVFRSIEDVSDADFLYYLVCSPLVRNPAIKSMVGSSGRQRVQTDVVADLDIGLPNIEEQRKIGSILRNLDDKIALNNVINNNLASLYSVEFKVTYCAITRKHRRCFRVYKRLKGRFRKQRVHRTLILAKECLLVQQASRFQSSYLQWTSNSHEPNLHTHS